MENIVKNYLAFGLVFVGLVVVVSVMVRGLIKKYTKKFQDLSTSSGVTGREFVRVVLKAEDLEVGVDETKSVYQSEFLWRKGMIRIPNLDRSSLLTLGLSAHELGHAGQVKDNMLLAATISFIERTGKYLSYFFPLIMVSGLTFYSPLLPVSLIVYFLILLILLVKIPFEVEASSRGLSYIEQYTGLTEKERARLKKFLWLAILTRLTDLTVGFLAVFWLNDQR